jgi:tetratricopeptide (TPR) repeat protein
MNFFFRISLLLWMGLWPIFLVAHTPEKTNKTLRDEVKEYLSDKNFEGARKTLDKYPSPLSPGHTFNSTPEYYEAWSDYYFEVDSALKAFSVLGKYLQGAMGTGDEKIAGKAYFALGYGQYRMGQIVEAVKNLEKAALKFNASGEQEHLARTENILGNIHSGFRQPEQAKKRYLSSMKYWEESGSLKNLAVSYNNLGLVHIFTKDTAEAARCFKESLRIRSDLGDSLGLGQCYNNLGSLRLDQGLYARALEYFNLGLAYRTLAGAPESALVESKINIGKALLKMGRYPEAEVTLQNCLSRAKEMKAVELERRITQELKELLFKTGRFAEAFRMQETFYRLTDSLFSREKREEALKIGLKYEFDQKMLEDSLRNAEQEKLREIKRLQEESIQKEKDIRNLVLFSALGVIILLSGFFIFRLSRSNQQKIRDNRIIAGQKNLLEEKQKEISDSINYARRIQEALLPSPEELHTLLPSHLLIYAPKDIISGDFLWLAGRGDLTWFAVGDCTGHGVPGAMMSMLGISYLNEILAANPGSGPGKILALVRQHLKNSLNRNNPSGSIQDGIDLALGCINKTGTLLTFSLEGRPLYHISGEIEKFFKPPSQARTGQEINQLTISLKKGDRVYMFSDGFPDQFGGPEGKKFKTKNLLKLLYDTRNLSLKEQEASLQQALTDWKGSLEQVDDICLFGIQA